MFPISTMSKPPHKPRCPSLNPPCDGTLKITHRAVSWSSWNKNAPAIIGGPVSAVCDKCGKVWTQAQLRTEGININQIEP